MRLTLPLAALWHLREWHVNSHVTSRRNALVASTELADRRRERVEVEEFMEGYLARRPGVELTA